MNSETQAGIGVCMMVVGFVMTIVFAYNAHQYNLNIERIEAQYMQDNYGYKDHMSDYLEYLQDHDIDSYMKLKPIYDEIHQFNYRDIISIHIFPVITLVGLCMFIFRE